MKNYLIMILTFLISLITITAYAQWNDYIEKPKEDMKMFGECPITHTIGSIKGCLSCHEIRTFKVQPTNNSKILINKNSEKYGYIKVSNLNDDEVKMFFDYLIEHNINKALIESNGPGGELFKAWRIIGIVNEVRERGISVDTIVYGYAASANFIVFMCGENRIASPYAELMYHQVRKRDFREKTPIETQNEADIMKHIQDSVNKYIADKSKLTLEELKKRIINKEFWMNGKEALEMGFVTEVTK